MRPKSPNTRPKVRITVGGDPNIASLMEAIRPHAGEAVPHAIHRAAMRLGLTLFARSPETLARALEREHHKLPIQGEDLKPRTVDEITRALEMPTKRAS
jgi:hypothetical protein